jgi:transposase
MHEGESGLVSRMRGRQLMSGRTLSLVQEWRLPPIITSGKPNQMNLTFALRNRRTVAELIRINFDIEMPIRTVGQCVQRGGYTPRRPVKRAAELDPRQVAGWLKTDYPKIAAKATAENAPILWRDQTAPAEHGHWVRGYAQAGQPPVPAAPTRRHGLTMLSENSNQGLARFEYMEGAINVERLNAFMENLIANSDRKALLILDNLKMRQAKDDAKWLSKRQDKTKVFYLPPYSPEINPHEYPNRDLKVRLRLSALSKTKDAILGNAKVFMGFPQRTPTRICAYLRIWRPAMRTKIVR